MGDDIEDEHADVDPLVPIGVNPDIRHPTPKELSDPALSGAHYFARQGLREVDRLESAISIILDASVDQQPLFGRLRTAAVGAFGGLRGSTLWLFVVSYSTWHDICDRIASSWSSMVIQHAATL
jgi:hypothetical protein